MELELIGGIYIVERFADGKERREELDGETVLKLVINALEQALNREEREQAPLYKKLSNTRMEHVVRKTDRRRKK